MASLVRYFKNAGPERIPSDTVIPLYDRDDTYANRNVAFEFTMRFDEVLDADKLADALWRLIEKPGWRKLGARMRMNDQSRLEYHIPEQFTKERPPINFTQFKYDMPLAEHPLGTILPKATGKLEVFNVEEPLREALHQPKDVTRVLNDWITTDNAQLGLHVCTFKDATFITLTWIHTLLDAMGRSALLKAWIAVLEGREDDVPDFHGYDTDPLQNLGASPSTLAASGLSPKVEESVLKSKQLGGLAMAKFVYNYMWEILFHPQEHGRIICMPASYLSTLRVRCLKDLDTLDPSLLTTNSSTGRPFLSDGDILCAWTTRLLARANPTLLTASAATRTMHVMNVFGMRDLLASASDGYAALLPPAKEGVYIANCASAIASLFTMQDFLTLPLGHIAAHLRRDLSVQGSRAQIEASQRLARTNGAYAQGMFGTGDMVLAAFTNWTKARLFEADFSAAIVTEAEGKGERGRGRPVYIHPDANRGKGFSLRGAASCVGRDGEGNWWASVMVREEFGGEVERLVREMEMEMGEV